MNHNNDDLGWHGINHKKLWSNQSIAQKIVNCNFFVPSSPICRHRFGALIDNCGEWQKNLGTQNLILARQMSLASSPDRPNLTLSRMIKWSWGWSNREAPRNILLNKLTCNNWIFHPQLMASNPLFGPLRWLSRRERRPHGLRPFGGPDHLKAIPLPTKDHERRRGHPQRNNFQHCKEKL